MLISVDVSNNQGGFLSLPLQDSTSGIVVKSIDGLDPVKATLVSSSFANLDGEQYQSAKREKRNIVLTLGLDPDFTSASVQDLRRILYGVCMPKSPVKLAFHTTNLPTLQINGYVESLVTPLFAQDPEVQISILCYDPDFIDPVPVVIDGAATTGLMETLYTYEGTVDTGILFQFMPTVTTSTFSIYNRALSNTLQVLDYQYSFGPIKAGEVVSINTVPGEKYVRLRNVAGNQSSVLQGVSAFSAWITLSPGANYFRVLSLSAVPYRITYTTRYGGL